MSGRSVGRPPKEERANRCCMVLTETEFTHFLTLYKLSGVPNKAMFIKARVFNKNFRVIKIDRLAVVGGEIV